MKRKREWESDERDNERRIDCDERMREKKREKEKDRFRQIERDKDKYKQRDKKKTDADRRTDKQQVTGGDEMRRSTKKYSGIFKENKKDWII